MAKQEGLKLTVLNGCSTEGHAQKLVEANIATIATANSIDDKIATDFAIRFYSALVNKIPLKKAFDETEDYVLTLTGTANLRTLYWEGADENTPNTVPWKLYSPATWSDYINWNIDNAYEALNITLAEKARKEWLKIGRQDTDPIERKTKIYLKNIRILSAIRHLMKSFPNMPYLQQYTASLLAEYRSIEKQEKKKLLLPAEIETAYSKINHALFDLMKDV